MNKKQANKQQLSRKSLHLRNLKTNKRCKQNYQKETQQNYWANIEN